MPIRPIIERLPPRLRARLNQRVRAAVYGDTIKIAAWLTAAGYPIKKSQIGRYAQKLRAQDSAATAAASRMTPAEHLKCAELRLGCLQAAIATGDKRTVLGRAERFAEWTFSQAVLSPTGNAATGK